MYADQMGSSKQQAEGKCMLLCVKQVPTLGLLSSQTKKKADGIRLVLELSKLF